MAVAAHVPVLLWGAPGTGKTSAIKAMSAALGLPCETVIASIREPSDFAGLPVMADGKVIFAPPRWARNLATHERGVLFLDEISTAPPAVQAALLRVVLERVVGDLALPEAITVIAAANPPEYAADGWDLSRSSHVERPHAGRGSMTGVGFVRASSPERGGAMPLPTEQVGSIPRPPELIDAVRAAAAGGKSRRTSLPHSTSPRCATRSSSSRRPARS